MMYSNKQTITGYITTNHKNLFLIFVLLITVSSISSCKKDKAGKDIDTELYDMAKETSGFVWYKNVDTLLPISAGSGHAYPFLRTRYNSIAASQLEANGKIKLTADFPEGSVIVKELYSTQTNLSRYAILYKKAENV